MGKKNKKKRKEEQSDLNMLHELLKKAPSGDGFGNVWKWMFMLTEFLSDIRRDAREKAMADLRSDLAEGSDLMGKLDALLPDGAFITTLEVSNYRR